MKELRLLDSLPGANIAIGGNLQNLGIRTAEIEGEKMRVVTGLVIESTGVPYWDTRDRVIAAATALKTVQQELAELGKKITEYAADPTKSGEILQAIAAKQEDIQTHTQSVWAALRPISGLKLYRVDNNYLVVGNDTRFRVPEGKRAYLTLSAIEVPIAEQIGKVMDYGPVGFRNGVVNGLVDREARIVRFVAIHGSEAVKGERNARREVGGEITMVMTDHDTLATQVVRVEVDECQLFVRHNVAHPGTVKAQSAKEENSMKTPGFHQEGRLVHQPLWVLDQPSQTIMEPAEAPPETAPEAPAWTLMPEGTRKEVTAKREARKEYEKAQKHAGTAAKKPAKATQAPTAKVDKEIVDQPVLVTTTGRAEAPAMEARAG